MFKVKNSLVFALSITTLAATSLTGCAKEVAEDAAPNGNNQALVEEKKIIIDKEYFENQLSKNGVLTLY